MFLDVVNLFFSRLANGFLRRKTWRQSDLFETIFLFTGDLKQASFPPIPQLYYVLKLSFQSNSFTCIVQLEHEKETVGRKKFTDSLGGPLAESSMTFSLVIQASAV